MRNLYKQKGECKKNMEKVHASIGEASGQGKRRKREGKTQENHKQNIEKTPENTEKCKNSAKSQNSEKSQKGEKSQNYEKSQMVRKVKYLEKLKYLEKSG